MSDRERSAMERIEEDEDQADNDEDDVNEDFFDRWMHENGFLENWK